VESTIVDLTCTPPRLLRPGGLPLEKLEEALGEVALDKAVTKQLAENEKPRAPGMKYRHYAPKAPVTVVTGSPQESGRLLCANVPEGAGLIVFDEFAPLFPRQVVRTIGSMHDKAEQARRVFDALRSFDDTPVEAVYAQCPDSEGLGLAVGNRLKKAAGFHTLDAAAGHQTFIGITGCTGAGKTSVLRALKRFGAENACILDCDAVYHDMLASECEMRRELQAEFPFAFNEDGSLDRKRLGSAVFGDREALSRLDALVRAHVPRETVRRAAASGARLVGVDAIKLVESGIAALCDTVVAVTAPERTRVERIMERDGITESAAIERVRAQNSEAFFREHCDRVFENVFSSPQTAEDAALEMFRILLTQ
ncbi:MAG: dephospho-CoA kinase, partial [Oscillospiraceae bacterium]|nr:dephospho-CoA kinase [Oscillospiraceae bacterium]